MPLPLSYPGLKCILENLEAVKRAHIVGRSPGLHKIDKLIPLCLSNLSIWTNNLTINELRIECKEDEVIFKINGEHFSRQISENQEDNNMKKLVHFYISGRSKIHLNKLDWFRRLPPNFLPVDLKIRVNSLDVFLDFETAFHIIDPRSYPLKTVTTSPDISTFDDQVVKFAEALNLNLVHHRTVTVEDLKKLNNKTVQFGRYSYSKIDIVPLIKYHVETKQDIRTTFVISTRDKSFIREMLHQFEHAFGEYKSDLDGVNERFIPGSSQLSIPINYESRIQVYAIGEPEEFGRLSIVVKPVSGL